MFAALLLALLPLAGGESAALTRALDAVSADELSADLHFIGSDELGGRDTPSDGLRIAARFLRARLERLGWLPGAEGGYFHTYPLAYKRLDEERSGVAVRGPGGERAFAYGEGYYLSSTRSLQDADFSGGVVYCGPGEEESFEGLDLAGAWALCIDSDVSWRQRFYGAREAGAVGLVVVPPAEGPEKPYAERFAGVLRTSRQGKVGWPSSREEERRDEAPFSTFYLDDPGAASLLAAAGRDALPDLGGALDVELTETRRLFGEGGVVELENVCGYWPGSDPELSEEVILVSAHYDHVGTKNGEVYNGADDNGSGTCTLLALAEALVEYGPMRRSVMLIWVSGEEKGLLGSRAWAYDPWLPDGARAVANINIDMVGRNAPDSLLVTPTSDLEEHYNGLTRLAEAAAPLEGFSELGSADAYWTRSDHAMFAKLGIPVAFLFSDVHEDYHKPGDTPDKIDYDKVRRVARLVLRILDGMQEDELVL